VTHRRFWEWVHLSGLLLFGYGVFVFGWWLVTGVWW
jgi:hypothetical protein